MKMLTGPTEVRSDVGNYRFVNPFIYEKTNKAFYVSEFAKLDASIQSNIDSATSDGLASTTSVYYRDLNDGHWTGINENDLYEPSSMLKVVTLMATTLLAQQNPGFLSEILYYTPTDRDLQFYKPKIALKEGYYSIDELVQEMIVNSDNGANFALLDDKEIASQFQSIYSIFQLPQEKTLMADFMSARSYSVIFRTLYNATLLSAYNSDQLLQLLTQTNFTQGLVAGVPSGIVVAHKFGERTNVTPTRSVINRELHDCGIVYYPRHPYLICVMTKGQDFDKQASVISEISKTVYSYVDATYKTATTTK